MVNQGGDCTLCCLIEEELKTPPIYEDKMYLCVECQTCHIPMWVLKVHRDRFGIDEQEELAQLTMRLFPGKIIRWEMHSILNHAHAHVEK